MKSPTLGIWPLICFPRISPSLSITTAVLCNVPLLGYLSRMDETITILCFLANFLKNCVDYPSIGSENSTHGYLSLVHIKNGAVHIYCKQTIFAFYNAAISIIYWILFIIACFCSFTGAVVGKIILFCNEANLTLRGSLVYSFPALILYCFT